MDFSSEKVEINAAVFEPAYFKGDHRTDLVTSTIYFSCISRNGMKLITFICRTHYGCFS